MSMAAEIRAVLEAAGSSGWLTRATPLLAPQCLSCGLVPPHPSPFESVFREGGFNSRCATSFRRMDVSGPRVSRAFPTLPPSQFTQTTERANDPQPNSLGSG